MPRLRGTRYWVTLGTLAAYSAAGTGKLAVAQTNSPALHEPAPDQIQALPIRQYDIPAGPLEAALSAFEAVSGIEVGVSEAGILAVRSPGVSGSFRAEKALDKLLTGTGLEAHWSDRNTVTLLLKSTTTSVDVTANAPVLEASLPKYQQPLNDTPQTLSVVPQQIMKEQANSTLRDALRNVAGISLAAGEGGSQGDNLTIRGFTAHNDLFIDGMRDFGSYYRDPFNTQEVEVLQGPSSVTFGRGSTGGVVNQASKTPELTQVLSADLLFGSDDTRRATMDINVPVSQLGSGAAFRMTAMGDIGGVAGRNVAENRRDGFAPSFALGLGTPTRLTLSYFHQNEDDVPDYGVPWLFNGPAPVNRSNYYGLQDANYFRAYDDIGTVKLDHDVNSNVTVRDQLRYANYIRDALITEPQLNGYTLSTPLSAMQVTRNEIGVNSTENYLDEQLDVTAHLNTGFVKQTLVTGVEGGHESSDPTRYKNTAPTTSLLDPNYTQQLIAPETVTTHVNDTAVTVSVYALDTVQIGKHWEFTGGLRFDRFDDTYHQTVAPVSNFERIDQRPSWRAAALYKPVEAGSFYFDAGTSFNPSAESLSLSAGNANLPPETNKSYEFGTKWNLNKDHFTVNSSWFRTTKENAKETSPIDSSLIVLAGTQRVSGAEVDVRGKMLSRWDVLASYAYLDSRVVGSLFYPGAVGYPLANVPTNTFNFWNDFRLPYHFKFAAGSNYESARTASSTVPLDPTTGLIKEVPGYWVFNAMAGHPINEHLDVQVNVYNLANRYYYDELHPGHIVLGPGRSAMIDFKIKF